MKIRSAITRLIRGSSLLLCLGTLLYLPAHAQGDLDGLVSRKFFYGPKAGVNYSTIINSAGSTGILRLGYSGGGFGQYRITDWLAASLEVQYLQMGSNRHYGINFLESGYDAGSSLMSHFVNTPVLLHVYIPTGNGKLEPKVVLGGAFSYNWLTMQRSVNFITSGGAVAIPITSTYNRTGDFNPFDVAMLAGLGLDVPLQNMLITMDLRYRLGFFNTTDIVTQATLVEDNNVYSGLQFSVGVGF